MLIVELIVQINQLFYLLLYLLIISFFLHKILKITMKYCFIIAFIITKLSNGIELNVDSKCPYPIWLATLPNYGVPDLPDGTIKLNSGASYTYQVKF